MSVSVSVSVRMRTGLLSSGGWPGEVDFLAPMELVLVVVFEVVVASSSSGQYPRVHGSSVQHPLNFPEWHAQKYALP